MSYKRGILWMAMLMVVSLAIAGCGSGATLAGGEPTDDHQTSPLSLPSQVSPLLVGTETSVPALAPAATLAPTLIADPLQLIVLHTNDNWGETEPCG